MYIINFKNLGNRKKIIFIKVWDTEIQINSGRKCIILLPAL